jgi:hypothetical protein
MNPPAWGAGERRFESGHPDWVLQRVRALDLLEAISGVVAAGSDTWL